MRVESGNYLPDLKSTLSQLDEQEIVKRIWGRDHTVWKPDPVEITNRLGWLNVIDRMREEIADLEAFSREIRDAGFQYVVLLGMGGSSLGPEVLNRTFGKIEGFPELIVLDSVDPDWIRKVAFKCTADEPEFHSPERRQALFMRKRFKGGLKHK